MSVNKENFREHLDALEDVDTEALTTRFYHDDFTIRAGDSTMVSFLKTLSVARRERR